MRIIIGGIVAGIVVFMWVAVTHIVLPLGEIGLSIDATPAEATVLESFKGLPESGFYMMPGRDPAITDAAEQMTAQQDAWAAGPSAIVIVQQDGGTTMGPALGKQFAAAALGGLVAAMVVASVGGGFFCRMFVVGLMGLFAWFTTDASYWIWYGMPDEYTLTQGAMHVSSWLLAGVALAAIVKPKAAAAPMADG